MDRLFGTDGVRGIANKELTPELAFQLGRSGVAVITNLANRPKIIIGRDTRISGDMLESALVAGVTSVGADVILLGISPTPAVAYLTKTLDVDAGIMISASHNPVEDNGIKFFDHTGFKLTDEIEDKITGLLNDPQLPRPIGSNVGRVFTKNHLMDKYTDFLVNCVEGNLAQLHVALDCANGAASQWAPLVLERLGAKVSIINSQPNGENINVNCGSTNPEIIQNFTKEVGADVGISHDGDADRVIACDEKGNLVNGDQILAICGLHMLNENQLSHKKLAATVYSNGGLKQAFAANGGEVIITQAGDRYVLEAMLEQELTLGGEQSGHIIFLEHNTTGDGILTALKLLSVMIATGKPLSVLCKQMPVLPQILTKVKVKTKNGWQENIQIKEAIKKAEDKLGNSGRIFVRASGTEPVIRIMGEHPDKQLVEEVVQSVITIVQTEQGD